MSKTALQKSTVNDLRSALEAAKPKFEEVASKHLNVDRLIRLLLSAASRTPKILECSRESVLLFAMKCSETGLEPIGAGGAWPIPFENRRNNTVELQFIPDYRGLIHSAKRAKCIKDAYAEIVKSNDHFECELGMSMNLTHKPARGNRGSLELAYCVLVLPDDSKRFVVMDADEIRSIKQRSRAAQSGPWVTDEAEMWKKTVVRRAMKPFAGASQEFDAALEADDALTEVITQEPIAMPKAIQRTATPPEDEAEEVEAGLAPAQEQTKRQKAKEPTEGASIQDQLADFLVGNGVSFDDFRDWLKINGHITDPDSLSSFNDLPDSVCQQLQKDARALSNVVKIYGKKA